jgi:hypothetical protein
MEKYMNQACARANQIKTLGTSEKLLKKRTTTAEKDNVSPHPWR